MKKIALLVGLLMLVSVPAQANGFYLGFKLGFTDTDLKTSSRFSGSGDYDTMTFNGVIGYDFYRAHGFPLRIELEETWQGGDKSDGTWWVDVDFLASTMLNFWYDFQPHHVIKPYLGGGIGFAWAWFDARTPGKGTDDYRKFATAYQLGGGVSFHASDSLAFDVGYRYFRTRDFEVNSNYDFYLKSHNLVLGMRFTY